MPRPVDARTTYLPGLDGIRALAVAAVFAYHVGFPLAPGGLLGVGVFFTLSGYLITGILLRRWRRDGRIDLKAFWFARARRLLPALFVVLAAVLIATAVVDAGHMRQRLIEALAATFYVSNWTTIAAGTDYFDRFAALGPLDHLWSLAVEEQFYLLWPLLLLGLLVALRGRLRTVAGVTIVLAAASFVLMAVLAHVGFDNTRAYEGADTRAGGLLVGAALAFLWNPVVSSGRAEERARTLGRRTRWALDGLGVAGFVAVAALVIGVDGYSMVLFHGGIVVLSLATAALVAAVASPSTFTAKALGAVPLRWVGERSYGIYLWHLPVIAFLPEAFLSTVPAIRDLMALAVTLALAAASWTLVENPIRVGGLRSVTRVLPVARTGMRAPVALAALAVVIVGAGGVASASAVSGASPGASVDLEAFGGELTSAADATDGADPGGDASGDTTAGPSGNPTAGPGASPAPIAPWPNAASIAYWGVSADSRAPSLYQPKTSCESVAHIGDSTSVGLMDPAILAEPADRIDSQYRRVGAASVYTDILGARSIVERYKGQPNAQQAADTLLANGFNGCWVIAMGLNEAANQAVGGTIPLEQRIDLMMQRVGNEPALWINVRTVRSHGPYADAEMVKWNAALLDACRRYPNIRVFDWRAEAPDSWYGKDGVHYTTQGWTERSSRIADALVAAFPADEQRGYECVVSSAWGRG